MIVATTFGIGEAGWTQIATAAASGPSTLPLVRFAPPAYPLRVSIRNLGTDPVYLRDNPSPIAPFDPATCYQLPAGGTLDLDMISGDGPGPLILTGFRLNDSDRLYARCAVGQEADVSVIFCGQGPA